MSSLNGITELSAVTRLNFLCFVLFFYPLAAAGRVPRKAPQYLLLIIKGDKKGPRSEMLYLEAVLKELFRAGQPLKYPNKQTIFHLEHILFVKRKKKEKKKKGKKRKKKSPSTNQWSCHTSIHVGPGLLRLHQQTCARLSLHVWPRL